MRRTATFSAQRVVAPGIFATKNRDNAAESLRHYRHLNTEDIQIFLMRGPLHEEEETVST